MEFNATFIVSSISFIAFSLIMNAIFYKPLQKIVSERQQFFDEHYEEASSAKAKAESLLNEKEQKLDESKHEAKKIIVEKTDVVKKQKIAITKEAQQKAATTIEAAKGDLHKSTSEAQEVLSNNVVDLAQNISSKILGQEIPIENTDKKLIDNIMQG